jgi:uroporphyrinogen-III synthase
MADRQVTILVTRPIEDAQPLAAELRSRGAEVLLEPMLDIVALEDVVLDLSTTTGLLFTSANGVRSFARINEQRTLKVFAVGDATAAAALAAGFGDVDSADGNIEDLVALVKKTWPLDCGPLLHAAGRTITGDLAAQLRRSGYDVRRTALYDATTATAFSEGLCVALRAGQLDFALFFSPRTANTFVSLAKTAGLCDTCEGVDAICLSTAVADVLAALPWRSLTVAAEPNQRSLLSAVDGQLAHTNP